MDFNALLAQAGSNERKNNKKLHEADKQMEMERRRDLERIATQKRIEKEELRRKLPPPPEKPKYVIPKKNGEVGRAGVDKNKVAAFLERQEREKREKLLREKQEKEELIKLRIEASGGKANKKIAKHFGKSPIELQMRYAHNAEHEQTLLRQAEREQEQQEQLSATYRQGVYRALNKKNEVVATVHKVKQPNGGPASGSANGFSSSANKSTRINSTTSAANGGALSIRSNNTNSTSTSKTTDLKKRKAPPPADFQTLMQLAQKNRELDPDSIGDFAAPIVAPKRARLPPAADERVGVSAGMDLKHASRRVASEELNHHHHHNDSIVNNKRDGKFDKSQQRSKNNDRESGYQSAAFKKPHINSALSAERRSDNTARMNAKSERIYVDPEMGVLKEKRYLPGDIRAKNPPVMAISGASSRPQLSSPQKRYLPGDIRAKQQQSGGNFGSTRPVQQQRAAGGPTSAAIPRGGRVDEPRRRSSPSRPSTNGRVPSMGSTSKRSNNTAAAGASSSRVHSHNHHHYNNNNNDADSDEWESELERKRRELREMELAIQRKREMAARRYNDRLMAKTKNESALRYPNSQRYNAYNNNNGRMDRERSPAIRYANYSEADEDDEEEEEDEDEYDSDMADFIDDDTEFDDLQRSEFEESLKILNRNYDTNKWKLREKMINARNMDARFHDIEKEERVSARYGLCEDLAEARRGSKALN